MSKQKKKKRKKQIRRKPKPKQVARVKPEVDSFDRLLRGRGYWLFIVLAGVAVAILFRDFLFFSKLYLFKGIGSDSINLIYPDLVHGARYLREEGLFGWSFNQGMGQNIFALNSSDPFRWLLYLLPPERIIYGVAWVEVLKVFLVGTVFYLYARKMNASPFAAIAGSLMLSFSAVMILGGQWFYFSTITLYFIFMLYAFERFYQDNIWSLLPVSIFLVTALQPFYLYQFALFLGVYVLFRYFASESWNAKRFARLIGGVIGLCVLGIFLSSVFSFGHVQEMMQSPRVTGDITLDEAMDVSKIALLTDKFQFVTAILRSFSSNLMFGGEQYGGWANYFESPMFYMGIPTLLLFPQVFVHLRRKEKIFSFFFILIWLLPVVIPFFRHLAWAFTGNYYRTFSLFVMFPLLLLTVRFLSLIPKIRGKDFILFIGMPVVLVGLLFFPYYTRAASLWIDKDLRFTILCFIAAYVILVYAFKYKTVRVPAQFIFLILLVAELCILSNGTLNDRPVVTAREYKSKVGYNDDTVEAVQYMKEKDQGFYRVYKNYVSGPTRHPSFNDAKVQDYYSTTSYYSFNHHYYIEFLKELRLIDASIESQTRWCRGVQRSLPMQTICNIKYLLTRKNHSEENLPYDQYYKPLKTFGDVTLHENRNFLPVGVSHGSYVTRSQVQNLHWRGRRKLLYKAVVVEDADVEAFSHLNHHDVTGYNFHHGSKELKADIANLKSAALEVTSHSQNRIEGTIEASQDMILFFTIPYDKGWTVRIDGKKQDCYRLSYGFLGLPVPAGHHAVTLSYRPPLLIVGLVVSALALLILIGLVRRNRRKNRK